MKTFVSEDQQVTKYIHEDGSETCIKTVPSLDTKADAGEVTMEVVDRNKYSVFISPSRGCPLNCSFCYLTIDEVPYARIDSETLEDNIDEAIEHRFAMEPSIGNRYMKVCWMGMGEPILKPMQVADVTISTLDAHLAAGMAAGLDGVDISTVLPSTNDRWIDEFVALNQILSSGVYPLNPKNRNADNVAPGSTFVTYPNRSVFRLFYSLHSAVQETRDLIIPNAMPLVDAAPRLQLLQEKGVDVIFHHMFLDGINDSEEELEALAQFMEQFPDHELRILRYNKHDDSSIKESDAFKECMCFIGGRHDRIKVQVSQGGDVKSACGQFIYNKEPVERRWYPKVDSLK